MMKSRVRIAATILFASLLCLQQQRYHYCNAAAPTSFVKKRRSIVTFPQLKRQIDTSSLLSSALSEDQDALSLPLTSSAAGHDANTETSTVAISSKKRSNNILRGGGSSILFLSSSTILPTITTILTQSLNIATAALVGSGYVGCYIASFIITQLHRYCTTAATIATTNNDGGSNLWKWKWTILANITHILSSSSNNNHHKNLIFLPTLWGYSHQINPTLGGIIGCTHLLLGGLSSLLGSQTVVNTLSELMDVRLPPLDDNGNMSYTIDSFLQEQQSNKNQSVVAGKEMLVRIFSSLGIFTSFPRDCLSLYLGSCALLTYLSSMTKEVMGEKTKLGMMSWWMNGLLLSGGGENGIGEDTAATSATATAVMVVDRKMITTRLFALHWVIMLVKGTFSLLLQ